MRHSPPSAAQSGRVSRSRAMPVGGPHRENWPALQAVRVASSVGGTCRDGSHPDDWGMRRRGPAGRCADCPEVGVPLPAGPSLPVGYAPSRESSRRLGSSPPRRCGPLCRPEVGVPSRPRAFSPSAVRSTHAGRMERHRNWFRAPARCRSETGAPRSRAVVPSGVCAERGAILTGWGFGRRGPAGRCADRRSAFQAVPALLRD